MSGAAKRASPASSEAASTAATTAVPEPWTYSYGKRPHTVYARERVDRGGVIEVRYTSSSQVGRDRRVRRQLALRVRGKKGALSPKLVRAARLAVENFQAELVLGKVPPREPPREPPKGGAARAPYAAIPDAHTPDDPLNYEEGFALALAPTGGMYASTTTRRYGDMLALRDILLSPRMLGSTGQWNATRPKIATELVQKMAAVHKDDSSRFGMRRAEQVLDCFYCVARWLRDNRYIKADACHPRDEWRSKLKSQWAQLAPDHRTEEPPRHEPAEMRAIFATLGHPARTLYRALLRCAMDGTAGALESACRKNILFDGHDTPVALRLSWLRRRPRGDRTCAT